MRPRKSEAVLASATALFLAKGFEATTVDEIAEAAHVSKATVYSNFADKAAVLAALLERVSTESAAILADMLAPLDGPGAVDERLVSTAVALARGVLRIEVLQLRRLAITESARFPAAVTTYFEQGPNSSVLLLARSFSALANDGSLVIPDPYDAAARFAYAVVGPLQDRALLTSTIPDDEETVRFATAAARAFLAAHLPRSSSQAG